MNETADSGTPATEQVKRAPKVSIGLPVYNGERFIRRAIESVLSQTFIDLELVISDNASTDDTQKICEQYSANDSRVRYVRQTTNLGRIQNYFVVLQISSGLYFAWLAHDDHYRNADHIALLVDALDRGATMAFPDVDIVTLDDVGEVSFLENGWMSDILKDVHTDRELRRRIVRYGNYPVYGLFKRAVLSKHTHRLLQCNDLRYYNEGLFVIDFVCSERIAFVPAATLVYYTHENGAMKSIGAPALCSDFAKYTFRVLRLLASAKNLEHDEKAALFLFMAYKLGRVQAGLLRAAMKWFLRGTARRIGI